MEWIKADTLTPVTLHVNGRQYRAAIEPRMLLSDFLRQECGLTGTHVGCEHGVCGACTVLVNGEAVRSCLMLAVYMRRTPHVHRDRKSTRLNSSHDQISYAVF